MTELSGVARDAVERCLRAADDTEATRAAIEALYAVDWPSEGEIPLPSELTAEQREVATALARRTGIGGVLPEGRGMNRFPIPLTARNRQQWLGLVPGGVLEVEESFERNGNAVKEPRWRRYRWLRQRGHVKDALAELDPVARAQAYVELGLGAYMVHTQDPELWALAEVHGKALGPWASQVAHAIVGHETAIGDDVKAALFHAVIAAGLPVDAAVERLFALDAYKPERNLAFVRALPADRREAVLAAAVAGGHSAHAIDAACTVLREFPFASVAKIAADRFADGIEGAGKGGKQHPALVKQNQDRQERLRRLAADRPELAEALRRGTAVVVP